MIKKRWLSMLLACCMMLTVLSTTALAAEGEETERFPYQYSTLDGNTVVKISHPKVSPNSRGDDARYNDGVVDYKDGVLYAGTYETLGSDPDSGARGESYSWSAIGYGDYIYVGLLYNAMGQTIQQFHKIDEDYQVPEKINELLDVMFNGDFFIQKDGQNIPSVSTPRAVFPALAPASYTMRISISGVCRFTMANCTWEPLTPAACCSLLVSSSTATLRI